MAVVAAKKLSQVLAHLAIAFIVTYAITGSMLVGGIAVLIEPVINVLLLPLHQRVWQRIRASIGTARRYLLVTAEKVSQTILHMGVAFSVMYAMTGSLAIGGLAAVLEPICNVLLLPFIDRAWESRSSASAAACAV